MSQSIRPVQSSDAAAIAAIYNPYIEDTVITFEVEPVTEAEMARRIDEIAKSYPYLVLELGGEVVAYAYATRWRSRAAYDQTVETAIYVRRGLHGMGLGARLYRELLRQLAERGFHMALGGISLPNPGSVTLHERCGFEKVAHHREVGRKFGRWVDVGFWQARLDDGAATPA